ncbi:SGNH/GDSL hydrolase family protein [Spiroplasma endosymbiont of Andrena trimmerana]|uniref:SGNH/GDSL hydrolase family protein n=1 Tax=Spiroplasma endosymbiont of Andrena trimmerana TaxID=3066316 RepID=UPI0030CFDB2F
MKNLIKLMTTCSLLMTNIISTLSNANYNTSNFQNNFYTLGDSLSDVGALVGAGSQFFQNIPLPEELMKSHDVQLKPPYYQNRSWCNGPVATELISKKLKQKVTAGWDFIALNGQHFSQIGTNYAVGGTFIEKVYGLEGLFLNKFSLDEQIKSLIKQHSDFYNDDLVFINIGTNDLMWIIDHNITDIDNAINKIINKLDEDLTELINKNIKKIVITNIADMGLILNYKETINQQPMTNLVNKFNLKLTEEIKKANKNFEKTNIKEYDVFSKFNKLFEQFKNRGSQYQDSNATKIDINTLGKNGILQTQYVSGANSQNIDNYFF